MPDINHFVFEESVVTTQSSNAAILRQKTKEVTFPLNQEVEQICQILEAEVHKQDAAGFAANQLGFNWAIAMINIPDPTIEKYREDHTDFLIGLLINPSYEGIGLETRKDWEACFSVPDRVGKVSRPTHIRYFYQDKEGKKIEAEATGLLARAIQHEVDHLNGVLWNDLADPADIMTMEAYRAMRQAEKESKKNNS